MFYTRLTNLHSPQQVTDILTNISSVEYLMICSTGDLELVTIHKKDNYNNGKLAAVSSSIFAMVQAFLAEIDLHGYQSTT